jgi:hypothetical protein
MLRHGQPSGERAERARIDLDRILSPFTSNQLKVIFSNMGALELTSGCSVGCDFCGLEAKKGVSGTLHWDDIVYIAEKFGKYMKKADTFLYYATDPLDWRGNGRDYQDVSALFEEKAGYHPFVSTAVPRGREELALEMLLKGKLDRVSVSYMNFGRLRKFFEEKYPLLKEQNFVVDVSDDGTRTVRFTGEPNSDGEKAWQMLLSKLASSKEQERIMNSSEIGINVRNLGSKRISNLDPLGIGCFHGSFLGNGGLFNQEIVLTSTQHPQGLIMTPIDHDSPRIYHKWYYPLLGFVNGLPNSVRKELTSQPPIRDFIGPVFADEVGKEVNLTRKRFLLEAYAFGIAFIERYDGDLKRIFQESDSLALTAIRMLVDHAEATVDPLPPVGKEHVPLRLDEDEPYDSRILRARERYTKLQRGMLLSQTD